MIEDRLHEITHLGFGGVMLWRLGDVWNGCLLNPDYKPDHSTNCWDHQPSPDAVVETLLGYAQRLHDRRKDR